MESRKSKGKGFWRRKLFKLYSQKLGRIIIFRSPIELDYAYLLEHDRSVISYVPQPFRIRYYLDGKYRRYTPDFRVNKSDIALVVENKPHDKVKEETYQTLFRIAGQICRREGYLFVVVTDQMVRVQPKLKNIKLLYRYAKVRLAYQHQFYLKELFQSRSETSIAEVASFLEFKRVQEPLSTVYGLVFRGFLEIDLMKPVGPESVVRLPEK